MTQANGRARTRVNIWRLVGWGGAAGLLLLPLVAMQFTREVDWTLSDFIIMGILIGGIGLLIEAAMRASGNASYRIGAIVMMIGCFMLIWVNLAVGIIGAEGGPNILYALVPTVLAAGGIISRFRAHGMCRALVAAIMVQVIIGAGAVAMGWGKDTPIWPRDIIGGTVIFTVVWGTAAALFARAARMERATG